MSSLPQSGDTSLLMQHYMGNKVGTLLSQEKNDLLFVGFVYCHPESFENKNK